MSDTSAPRQSSPRANSGQFKPGNPGGPGRPRKAPPVMARRLDEIASEGAERIVRALVDRAFEGDARAAELILSRAWPKRSGRPIEIADFLIALPSDCVAAAGVVAQATLRGDLTASEGRAAGVVIEVQRRMIGSIGPQDEIEPIETMIARYKEDLK